MTTQHTPGPWTINDDEDSPLIWSDQARTYVAQVFARDDGTTGTARGAAVDADARLISAAPEMLAALERVLQAMTQVELSDSSLQEWYAAKATVRAAIAKAAGDAADPKIVSANQVVAG